MRAISLVLVMALGCSGPGPSPDAGPAVCGDGVPAPSEQCDPGGGPPACPYGARECLVCGSECRYVLGATSFCGDARIDAVAGEECDGAPCASGQGCSECRCEIAPGCAPAEVGYPIYVTYSPFGTPFVDLIADRGRAWRVGGDPSPSTFVSVTDAPGIELGSTYVSSGSQPATALTATHAWVAGITGIVGLERAVPTPTVVVSETGASAVRAIAAIDDRTLIVATGTSAIGLRTLDVDRLVPGGTLDLGSTVAAVAGGDPPLAATVEGIVTVVDASDPDVLRAHGSLDLGAPIAALDREGDLAVALTRDAASASVHVIDVSDPSAPRARGTVAVDARMADLALFGTRAYAAGASASVRVVDLVDPDAPTITDLALVAASQVAVDRSYGLLQTNDGTIGAMYDLCL